MHEGARPDTDHARRLVRVVWPGARPVNSRQSTEGADGPASTHQYRRATKADGSSNADGLITPPHKPQAQPARRAARGRCSTGAGGSRGEACATSAAACLLHAGPRGRGRTARLTVVTETVNPTNDRRVPCVPIAPIERLRGNPTGLFSATARPREFCDSAVAAWAWPVPIRGTANLEVATTPEALPVRRTGLAAAS